MYSMFLEDGMYKEKNWLQRRLYWSAYHLSFCLECSLTIIKCILLMTVKLEDFSVNNYTAKAQKKKAPNCLGKVVTIPWKCVIETISRHRTYIICCKIPPPLIASDFLKMSCLVFILCVELKNYREEKKKTRTVKHFDHSPENAHSETMPHTWTLFNKPRAAASYWRGWSWKKTGLLAKFWSLWPCCYCSLRPVTATEWLLTSFQCCLFITHSLLFLSFATRLSVAVIYCVDRGPSRTNGLLGCLSRSYIFTRAFRLDLSVTPYAPLVRLSPFGCCQIFCVQKSQAETRVLLIVFNRHGLQSQYNLTHLAYDSSKQRLLLCLTSFSGVVSLTSIPVWTSLSLTLAAILSSTSESAH